MSNATEVPLLTEPSDSILGFQKSEEFWLLIKHICLAIFPFQAFFGITCNSINLIVLRSRHLRNRTNFLLGIVAIVDVCFLVVLGLAYSAQYSVFVTRADCPKNKAFFYNLNSTPPRTCATSYYNMYRSIQYVLNYLTNWCLTTSNWLIVIVCFDRLWAIKAPLKSHTSPRPVFAAIVCVAACSALLNAFHNIAYVAPKSDRPAITGDTNLTASTPVPMIRDIHFTIIVKVFATASVFLNTFSMVLLILSNALLLHYLRSRHQNFQVQRWNSSKMSFDSWANNSKESYGKTATDPDTRSSKVWSRRQCTNERKITLAVFLIVCCYTVTNLPSTALFFYIYTIRAGKFYVNNGQVAAFYLSNALIVFGKIANFFFLCHSSAYYRRQLQKQLCSWAKLCWWAKTTPVPSTTGAIGTPGYKDPPAMRVHYAKVDNGGRKFGIAER